MMYNFAALVHSHGSNLKKKKKKTSSQQQRSHKPLYDTWIAPKKLAGEYSAAFSSQ